MDDKLNYIMAILLSAGGVTVYSLSDHSAATTDPWFAQTVLKNPRPVVVKFGADWCGACVAMDPAFTNVQAQFRNALFVKIDIDQKEAVWREFRSGRGIPQTVVFNKGRVVSRQRGFGGEERFRSWLARSL